LIEHRLLRLNVAAAAAKEAKETEEKEM